MRLTINVCRVHKCRNQICLQEFLELLECVQIIIKNLLYHKLIPKSEACAIIMALILAASPFNPYNDNIEIRTDCEQDWIR